MSNLKPPPFYKIIVMQLVAATTLAATSLIFSNAVAAYSILIGGLVSAVPNCYFAIQAFKYQGATNAKKVVRSFMKGEIGKIGITIVMFAVVFSLLENINEIALITGFVAVQFIGIMASGLMNNSPTGSRT